MKKIYVSLLLLIFSVQTNADAKESLRPILWNSRYLFSTDAHLVQGDEKLDVKVKIGTMYSISARIPGGAVLPGAFFLEISPKKKKKILPISIAWQNDGTYEIVNLEQKGVKSFYTPLRGLIHNTINQFLPIHETIKQESGTPLVFSKNINPIVHQNSELDANYQVNSFPLVPGGKLPNVLYLTIHSKLQLCKKDCHFFHITAHIQLYNTKNGILSDRKKLIFKINSKYLSRTSRKPRFLSQKWYLVLKEVIKKHIKRHEACSRASNF